MTHKRKLTNYTIFVALVAAIGGVLFGSTASVISGGLLFITGEFQLTVVEEEVIVSTLLLGCLVLHLSLWPFNVSAFFLLLKRLLGCGRITNCRQRKRCSS